MEVLIYQADSQEICNDSNMEKLLLQLPKAMQSRALRYRFEKDRMDFLTGRFLLKRGFEYFKIGDEWTNIETEANGKPYSDKLYFNISHSAGKVVCAFSEEGKIGIDIEKVRPIDFKNFTAFFSEYEWQQIKSSAVPMLTFFRFWTRKESIIKALGVNLAYLHKIELDVQAEYFEHEGKMWFLKELGLKNGFCAAICTERKISKQLNFPLCTML